MNTEQVTEQVPEQVTEQAPEQFTGQVPEQFTEQVTEQTMRRRRWGGWPALLLLMASPSMAQTSGNSRSPEVLELRLLDLKLKLDLQQLKPEPTVYTREDQRLELRRLGQGIEVKLNGLPVLDTRFQQPLPTQETCTLWVERLPSSPLSLDAAVSGEGCDDAPEPPCAEDELQLDTGGNASASRRKSSTQSSVSASTASASTARAGKAAPSPTKATLRCLPRP